MIKFKIIIILFVLFLLPNSLFAISSTNVPIDDPVYRELDKLIAFGLIKDDIYGQRPWNGNQRNNPIKQQDLLPLRCRVKFTMQLDE